jgi:translation initiation factor 1
MKKNSRLVYSTDKGRIKTTDSEAAANSAGDGIVRIRRETSGRKGNAATTISGVPLPEAELKALAKKLKQSCGSGGSVKNAIIEIQGDHRDKVSELLTKEGYTVKMAGG